MPSTDVGDQFESDVTRFYSGRSIFLTGGTGFLGKTIIEKLLYSCHDIGTVYVLVREKNGEKPAARLAHLTRSHAFDRLKEQNPKQLSKIVPVIGDLKSSYLGLSDKDLKCLEENVSVVLHVAATVNFAEQLSEAFAVNVNGTEQIIKLCSRIKDLQAFIHVSTAYCNTDLDVNDEIVYPPPHDLKYARTLADTSSSDEEIVKLLIGKRPNTYTYSKAFGENLVKSLCNDLPVAIVRPSIVTASVREPSKGWLDSWLGPTVHLWGTSSGLMRAVIGRHEKVADLIPVDLVTNLIITAATKCEKSREVKVYNCCTGSLNPITWGHMCDLICKTPACRVLPFPHLIFTTNRWLYLTVTFMLQIIPSFLLDVMMKLLGRTPRFMKIQSKLNKVIESTAYFTSNGFNFPSNNVQDLLLAMNPTDRQLFDFDVKTIRWEDYMRHYVQGVQKYLILPVKVK